MARVLTAIVLIAFVSGCQAPYTQCKTNDLATSLPDLVGQQIVDNLAMLNEKPCGLPFFGFPIQGSEINTRYVQGNFTPTIDYVTSLGHFLGDKYSFGLTGQFQDATSFQLQPLNDPDKLTLIQIALRWAMGDTQLNSAEKAFLIGWYQQRNDPIPIYYKYYWAITHTCLDKAALPTHIPPKPEGGASSPQNSFQNQVPQGSPGPIVPTYFQQPFGSSATPTAPPNAAPPMQFQLNAAMQPAPKLDMSNPGTTSLPSFPNLTCPPQSIVSSVAAPAMPPVMRAAWFCSTQCKHDVPKDAIYVGHCGTWWVWVPPEGRREFTDFTLAILDIATLSLGTTLRATQGPDKTALKTLRSEKLSELKNATTLQQKEQLWSELNMLDEAIEAAPPPQPSGPQRIQTPVVPGPPQ